MAKALTCHGVPWRFVAASGGIVNTAEVDLVVAAAGKTHHVTELEVVNASATGTEVVIRDGAAGTVLYRTFVKDTIGPVIVKFLEPLVGTAGNKLVVACITTATQTYVNARGVTL